MRTQSERERHRCIATLKEVRLRPLYPKVDGLGSRQGNEIPAFPATLARLLALLESVPVGMSSLLPDDIDRDFHRRNRSSVLEPMGLPANFWQAALAHRCEAATAARQVAGDRALAETSIPGAMGPAIDTQDGLGDHHLSA